MRRERLLTGEEGELVSLLPVGGPAEGVTAQGLRYPLSDETLAAGSSRGVSNASSASRPGSPFGAAFCSRSARGARGGNLVTQCCKAVVLALVALVALTGCGGEEKAPKEVVLVTHDSFAVSKPVRNAFERETGLKLRILQSGDAGEALNRALLTAGDPQGDAFFGVDNTLLSRALLDEDLFEAYDSPELAHVPSDYILDREHRVTPIDHGEVCLNYDKAWFREHGIRPPQSFDDLAELRYRTCLWSRTRHLEPRPGVPARDDRALRLRRLAGLLAELKANGVLVVDGWEEAYTVRFSGSSGKGKRPIVSYASSSPAEVAFAGKPLRGADCGGRFDVLPAGGARGRAARRAQRGRRAEADRFHAHADVPARRPARCSSSPCAKCGCRGRSPSTPSCRSRRSTSRRT